LDFGPGYGAATLPTAHVSATLVRASVVRPELPHALERHACRVTTAQRPVSVTVSADSELRLQVDRREATDGGVDEPFAVSVGGFGPATRSPRRRSAIRSSWSRRAADSGRRDRRGAVSAPLEGSPPQPKTIPWP